MSLALRACVSARKVSGGSPRVRQFETTVGLHSNIAATALVPPSWSITSSAVLICSAMRYIFHARCRNSSPLFPRCVLVA